MVKKSRAAYTIVNNDMVILELWLSYYSRYFDHLFVYCNGTKDEYGDLEPLKEKYKFETQKMEFTDDLAGLLAMLREKQVELLKDHQWVLYTNCDEYVMASDKYKDLGDLMDRVRKPYIACEGYEVIQSEGEKPLDYSRPIFEQREYWFKNNIMNKIILSKVPLEWVSGHHKIGEMTDDQSRAIANTGLYLVHLKYADMDAVGRDLGPYKTNYEKDLLEKAHREKVPVPSYIKELL